MSILKALPSRRNPQAIQQYLLHAGEKAPQQFYQRLPGEGP